MTDRTTAPAAPTIAVVLATKGRADQVVHLLRDLDAQTWTPSEVIISATTPADVPELDVFELPIRVITGPAGLTKQRNAGLAALTTAPALVAFLDDDLRIHPHYLARAADHFDRAPQLSGLSGCLLGDGAAAGAAISQDTATTLLAQAQLPRRLRLEARSALYGCNMVVRTQQAIATRFDEQLPLYGWLEDLDFGLRLEKSGYLRTANDLLAVHLGASSGGRTSHLRYGYSQIANPHYLRGKQVLTAAHAYTLVVRALAANSIGAVTKPGERAWRLSRLRGNLWAGLDLACRRIHPLRVTELN